MTERSRVLPRADASESADHLAVRLDTSLELLVERAPADDRSQVLATVVATAGSTYRKAGARMLIMADGTFLGLLSGGCLEADLHIHAQRVLASAMPCAIEYDMRSSDDLIYGLGAGCEGAMRVLLEPMDRCSRAATALAAAGHATRAGLPTALVTVHESSDIVLGTYSVGPQLPAAMAAAGEHAQANSTSQAFECETARGRTRAFVQFLAPPPCMLICGAGPDAEPLVSAARALRWQVTVVDHRPAYALASRFPGAEVKLADASSLRAALDVSRFHAAVVMSHHLPSDAAYLRELAEAGTPPYVGLLGPMGRRSRLAKELGATAEKLGSRLSGPVGLDIGAATPEGIALAIVSEIHAWLAGRATRKAAFC
jgi:xanthine/CO dehydrogenase XdhC/CoxF family maturation factor